MGFIAHNFRITIMSSVGFSFLQIVLGGDGVDETNMMMTSNILSSLWTVVFPVLYCIGLVGKVAFLLFSGFMLGYSIIRVPLFMYKRVVECLPDVKVECSFHRRKTQRWLNTNIINDACTTNGDFRQRRVFIVGNLQVYTTVANLQNLFNWDKDRVNLKEAIEIAVDPNNMSKRIAVVVIPSTSSEIIASGILDCHKRLFKGNIITVTEVKNRKYSFGKNIQWICKKPNVFTNNLQEGLAASKLKAVNNDSEFLLVDAGSYLMMHNTKSAIESALQRATDAGIQKIIIRCSDIKESCKASKLCEKHPGYLYFTAGVDASEAADWNEDVKQLEDIARHPQCVAIGETGLDFMGRWDGKTKQIRVFRTQVELACRLKKTLCVNVGWIEEYLIYSILLKYQRELPVCRIYYRTNSVQLQLWKFIQLGCYVSVIGESLKMNSSFKWFKEMLKDNVIPLNRIVIESSAAWDNTEHKTLKDYKASLSDPQDGQYLTEINFRRAILSQYNEDLVEEGCLPFAVELLASTLNCPTKKLASILNDNANRLYNLK